PALSTLSLHDALPISHSFHGFFHPGNNSIKSSEFTDRLEFLARAMWASWLPAPSSRKALQSNSVSRDKIKPSPSEPCGGWLQDGDRKSTRLNSSHVAI